MDGEGDGDGVPDGAGAGEDDADRWKVLGSAGLSSATATAAGAGSSSGTITSTPVVKKTPTTAATRAPPTQPWVHQGVPGSGDGTDPDGEVTRTAFGRSAADLTASEARNPVLIVGDPR